MATAYVSYSSADKYFADLLVKMLEYHHIEFWYDRSNIELGKKYKDEIARGLTSADYLIVLVSENSLNSKWVARELTEFIAKKPDAQVIPLLLSPIPADEIFDGLKEYQAIFFYENMLDGFKVLLSFFGKEFLPLVERRQKQDQRIGERRQGERRKAPLIQRLRIGMWKYYENETGRGKFDTFTGSTSEIMGITHKFIKPDSELTRYDFLDKSSGKNIPITQDLLTKTLYIVLDKFRSYGHLVEVIVIESLAEELNNMFDIQIRHRRKNVDQRSNSDRRDSKKS